jgi:hypothetical protein
LQQQPRRRHPPVLANRNYQITHWLRANAGYTFLLWAQVVRPGDAIDTTVNPNLLPPANPLAGGPTHPLFTGGPSTFGRRASVPVSNCASDRFPCSSSK